MGYLAYILAVLSLLFRDTHGMTFNQVVKVILDTAGLINGFFFTGALVVLVLMALVAIVSAIGRSDGGMVIGCMLFLQVGLLTIGQGVVLLLNVIMAESWGLEGMTDPVKFLIAAVITLLIGLS